MTREEFNSLKKEYLILNAFGVHDVDYTRWLEDTLLSLINRVEALEKKLNCDHAWMLTRDEHTTYAKSVCMKCGRSPQPVRDPGAAHGDVWTTQPEEPIKCLVVDGCSCGMMGSLCNKHEEEYFNSSFPRLSDLGRKEYCGCVIGESFCQEHMPCQHHGLCHIAKCPSWEAAQKRMSEDSNEVK
jgi:hypothetical protein